MTTLTARSKRAHASGSNSTFFLADFAMAIDFYGPRLKVERAEHHIDKLEAVFGQYIRDNMKRLRPERKQRLLKSGQSVRPSTFPKHTPTILGDILHNLRVSLDHAYHIVAEANGAAFSEWRRFPFGQDRQSLAASINGHKKEGIAPSDKVIAAILDEIQPYDKGKLGLYGLHKLDITDKHIVLIPTFSKMEIKRLDLVDKTGAKTGWSIQGFTLTVDQSKGGDFFNLGSGGAILQGDPKDAFKICFQKGQPFEGQGILDTVRSLKQGTIEALDLLLKAAS